METLNLNGNSISVVSDFMFSGANALRNVDLSFNNINQISDTALRPLVNLTILNLNNNQIRRIPGNLVLTNTQLTNFYANNNQINEMGRRFLDPVINLNSLQLANNLCINGNWVNIGVPGGPTKNQIRTLLESCFVNYGGPTEQQNFFLELRGSLRLYDLEAPPNNPPVLVL